MKLDRKDLVEEKAVDAIDCYFAIFKFNFSILRICLEIVTFSLTIHENCIYKMTWIG